MRRIGGVNMNAVVHLTRNSTKDNIHKKYCSVYESLEESLKELKLYKMGKIKLDTWDKLYDKLKDDEE